MKKIDFSLLKNSDLCHKKIRFGPPQQFNLNVVLVVLWQNLGKKFSLGASVLAPSCESGVSCSLNAARYCNKVTEASGEAC